MRAFVRWFNELIEPLPSTLTILVAGVLVWPAFFVLLAWVLIWVLWAPALLIPGLR